jgi:hypothetical protein
MKRRKPDIAKIIKPILAPKEWTPRGMFDTPVRGPSPATLREVGEESLVDGGRNVLEACSCLGSYGMGGPGFLGFHLEKSEHSPDEWLVLCLWGADEWVRLDGKKYENGDELCKEIDGSVLCDIKVSDRKFEIFFRKKGSHWVGHTMVLECNGRRVVGNPAVLAKDASLKDALFVSHEQWLYV